VAAFWCTGAEFVGILEEYAGTKAGLALARDQLLEHIPSYRAELPPDDNQPFRVRHEKMEGAVRELLLELGAVRSVETPSMALLIKYYNDPESKLIADFVSDQFSSQVMKAVLGGKQESGLNLSPVAGAAIQRYGLRGQEIFAEFLVLLTDYQQGSLGSFRRTKWKDIKELDDLFSSGELRPTHGTFLDQRFIDYLATKNDALDSMHWRQFEALTAEFFDRQGYAVELGSGVGDDGIDVRVWQKDDAATEGAAPTILVQCKRQREKVGKVVVKALWADVVAENAKSGLIVTTSALQPGAAKVCLARGYSVSAAERSVVVKWLHALRTPGSGTFMSG
jgi:restriction system protein